MDEPVVGSTDGPADEQGRLFVAVIPPEPVIEALRALPRPDIEGVRWTKPEQWHVTLRFLGDAPIAAAVTAFGRLEAAAARAVVGPRIRRLGQRVAMLPVGGLDGVAAAAVAATGGVGQPPEDRNYVGHITLARSRNRMPKAALGAELEAAFDVDTVHLVRSHLDDVGPRYEVVSARHLS